MPNWVGIAYCKRAHQRSACSAAVTWWAWPIASPAHWREAVLSFEHEPRVLKGRSIQLHTSSVHEPPRAAPRSWLRPVPRRNPTAVIFRFGEFFLYVLIIIVQRVYRIDWTLTNVGDTVGKMYVVWCGVLDKLVNGCRYVLIFLKNCTNCIVNGLKEPIIVWINIALLWAYLVVFILGRLC